MKRSFLLLLIALVVGCSKTVKTPKGILEKDKMISILLDIHIKEGQVQQLRVIRDSSTRVFKYFEREIFAKHEVLDSVYYNSLSFYYDHPELMEEIYTAIVDSLSVQEQLIEGRTKEGN